MLIEQIIEFKLKGPGQWAPWSYMYTRVVLKYIAKIKQ